jgi:hypothetical protein
MWEFVRAIQVKSDPVDLEDNLGNKLADIPDN